MRDPELVEQGVRVNDHGVLLLAPQGAILLRPRLVSRDHPKHPPELLNEPNARLHRPPKAQPTEPREVDALGKKRHVDQRAELAHPEPFEKRHPLGLGNLGVDRRGRDPPLGEVRGVRLGVGNGRRRDDPRPVSVRLDQPNAHVVAVVEALPVEVDRQEGHEHPVPERLPVPVPEHDLVKEPERLAFVGPVRRRREAHDPERCEHGDRRLELLGLGVVRLVDHEHRARPPGRFERRREPREAGPTTDDHEPVRVLAVGVELPDQLRPDAPRDRRRELHHESLPGCDDDDDTPEPLGLRDREVHDLGL